MTDKIDVIALGGTLFVPATHKDILEIANCIKYPNLRSVVIDTEDSISQENLPKALQILQNTLKYLIKSNLFVFIRPRDSKTLKELLDYENIDKINGFILPKFSLKNADDYLDILKDSSYFIMPSIEGKELFNQSQLGDLRDKLLSSQEKIIAMRFGLEDMLRQLSMRRACEDSIFDFSSTNVVLGNFISVFKSSGFEISGGVYPCFKDSNGFKKDVKRDLKEGLFSKTIIHPNQINIINELYKVSQLEYDEANEILRSKEAVFNQNSKMAERTTMNSYSKNIIKRADYYGIH